MSIESDAASQITSVYLKALSLSGEAAVKVGEQVFKLAGKLLKELFKFIAKSISQEGKSGRLLLTNMLTQAANEGKTLSIIRINGTEDFDKISSELKSHGVTFSKARGKDCYDILVFEEDAPRINVVFEKLGFNKFEKITDAKAERVTEKTEEKADSLAVTPDYEQELPFDEDIKYYDSMDNLVDDYLKTEKERGDKAANVPTNDRENPVKEKDSQQQPTSEKESVKHGKTKQSQHELIKEKKEQRAKQESQAEKTVDSPAKTADTAKNLNTQEVKSK